jgi:multisubunit Na+/H+ antiporter MnhB subunit
MDPYFRPILIASLVGILLNTFLTLPIVGFPILSYMISGIIAVLIFRNNAKKNFENYEVKLADASILGIATGVVVGSVLALIMAINLQNPELKQMIIDKINEASRMQSQREFSFIDSLNPSFYIIMGLITIFFTSAISFFGSIAILPFINKAKK